MSFSDLKNKDIINVCDGRKLGRPIDLIFTDQACIESIVVPGPCSLWGMLKAEREGYVISWDKIRRIGDDVILVELDPGFFQLG